MRNSTVPRLTRPRLAVAGVSLAIAATLLGAGLASSATAATATAATATATAATSVGNVPAKATTNSAAKPTIVLVHGAWADSSSWNAVVQKLQSLGYTVDAPPNPLAGVSEDSASLADFLGTISGPIVLVGHSYGGFVITNAATGNPQVKALVYDDAFIPAAGDTPLSLSSAQPGSCLADASAVFNFVPFPGGSSADPDLYVKQSVFPGCFANGLPAREGAALAAEQQPLPFSALSDSLTNPPAWRTIPSWAIIGTQDHVIPPAEQLVMAHQAGARITEIRAPHLSMISDPGAVTSVIINAARATS